VLADVSQAACARALDETMTMGDSPVDAGLFPAAMEATSSLAAFFDGIISAQSSACVRKFISPNKGHHAVNH
jgi:hypothetical protein